jgi:UDP-N-acetylmuramyl pentapeptide synthase
MHCHPGLQEGRGSSKIAVLDTIHGALTLARRMNELDMKADALEVYHHTPSVADYDIVVAPVHLGPKNPVLVEAKKLEKPIITHHQAAGELLGEEETDIQVFEVTGTHSKTTTALLAARILSRGKKVLSHTTRGLELWAEGESRTTQKGLSITPANVIPAFDAAKAQNVDALISEISLGGTGTADFGILTSFSGDYRIAGESAWASTAKLQMVSLAKCGSKLLSGCDVKISSDLTFGADGDVRAERNSLHFGESEVALHLNPELDFPSYRTALSAAAAAAWEAGLSPEDISDALSGFDGVSGRMKVSREGAVTVYDCSNSGLKLSDVRRALDLAAGGSLGLVVGEEAETVCEGMDIPGLVDLLSSRRKEIGLLVLVGERLLPWAETLKAKTAPDLSAGISLARLECADADRLLSCVKCFR